MALNIEKVAPDRSHGTKFPGVVEGGNGCCTGMDTDVEVYVVVAKTLKCN